MRQVVPYYTTFAWKHHGLPTMLQLLKEKYQDNISNRATAEKETLILEKDKEDRSIISSIQSHFF